ncbi:UNVERIFIED_CONTAM: hypothetical protein K2H54_012361 [Gekko kuhli]
MLPLLRSDWLLITVVNSQCAYVYRLPCGPSPDPAPVRLPPPGKLSEGMFLAPLPFLIGQGLGRWEGTVLRPLWSFARGFWLWVQRMPPSSATSLDTLEYCFTEFLQNGSHFAFFGLPSTAR